MANEMTETLIVGAQSYLGVLISAMERAANGCRCMEHSVMGYAVARTTLLGAFRDLDGELKKRQRILIKRGE